MATNILRQANPRRFPLMLRPHGLVWAGVTAALLLTGLLVYGYPFKWAVCWALLLGGLVSVKLAVRPQLALLLSRFCFAASPLVTYSLVEILNYNHPWGSFTALQLGLNLVWYYLGLLVLYFLTGRRDLAARLGMFLGWVLGMANRYAIFFRGRTLFPADFVTLRTALNVAGSYDYTPDQTQVFTGLILLLCLLVSALLPKEHGRRGPSLRLAIPAILASGSFLILFFCTDFLDRAGIEPSMWTTRGNGLALNFSVCLRNSRITPPAGYGKSSLTALRSDYPGDAVPVSGMGTEPVTPVNIIAIMNESFSDLGVIPGTEANQDWMPFWHSLTENTVKGYAYSSVFGGTTANSEYEFLTGNTTAFLPTGVVPYHMYVSKDDPSLVRQLNSLGYRSTAMHPYYASGWNRVPVYEDLGFDQALFLDAFPHTEEDLIRGYLSDQRNYEVLIDQYEQKAPGEKLFLFNVTMQNHSGYDLPWTNLERNVWLTGDYAGQFPTVNQNLSVLYESDKAFEHLIEYFSNVEEPTMILMFGDHQPQVSTTYYQKALGGLDEELDPASAQRKRMVPFLIWANYDIPEADGVELSINYLSTLLAKTANLPLTGYQQFLDHLSQILPVINTAGYQESTGQWTNDRKFLSAQAQAALNDYRQLLYNNIFDKSNRLHDFFTLPE